MPRIKALKPVCPTCGHSRFMGCWLGEWVCAGIHAAFPRKQDD